jgi:hypothetical protein
METSLLEKQMLGKPVDASELLRVQDALKAIVPDERPMLHRVEIQLVGTFCPKCKERYEQPTLPPPIEPVVKDVTPATPDVVTATDEARILHPDKIDVPVKRVRHNEPEPPMFSACTIGKGMQTSDRWSR